MTSRISAVALSLLALAASAQAQESIEQYKGLDARVDYAALLGSCSMRLDLTGLGISSGEDIGSLHIVV